MKKHLIIFLSFIMLLLSLTGCAKCISTEYKEVEVSVVDEYHRSRQVMPMPAGKTVVTVIRPAKYEIVVEYNGVYYILNNRDIYERYKDKVGQTVTGTLEIRAYDDGAVRYDIVSLK